MGFHSLTGRRMHRWPGWISNNACRLRRAFWHWYKRFDWLDELAAMPCPRLLYVGADDRTYAPGSGVRVTS